MENDVPPSTGGSGECNENGFSPGDNSIPSPHADIEEPSILKSAVGKGHDLFGSTGTEALQRSSNAQAVRAAPNGMTAADSGGKSQSLVSRNITERPDSITAGPSQEWEGDRMVSSDAAVASSPPDSGASSNGTVPPKAAEASKTTRTSSSNGLRRTTRGQKGSRASDHHDDMMHAMCMICLEKLHDVSEGGRAKLLGVLDSCSHRYCYTCILEWSKITNKCPQCKARFHTIKAIKELRRSNDKYRGVAVRVEDRDQRYSFVDVRDVVVLDPESPPMPMSGSPVLPTPPAHAGSAPSTPPTGGAAPAKTRGRPRGSKNKPPVDKATMPALESQPEGLRSSASSAETSVPPPQGDGQPNDSAQPSAEISLADDEPSRQDTMPKPPQPPAPSFLRSLEASEFNDLCTICGFDTEPDNLIVYCSSCNMGVHQTCYGISEIPTKEWYCSPCAAGVHPSTLACRFCPIKGGALKRCTDGSWGHILCAFWIPECCFLDPQKMEPIGSINKKGQAGGVEKYLPAFRARKCYVCGTSAGSAIRCHTASCKFHLHPMCGSKAGSVYMEIETTMKRGFDGTEHESVNLVARCPRHSKKAKGAPGSVNRGAIIGSTADPLSILDKAIEIKDAELGGFALAGKVTWFDPVRSKYCIVASGHGGGREDGAISSCRGERNEVCSHWLTIDKLVEAKAIAVQRNGRRFEVERLPSLEGEEAENGELDSRVKIERHGVGGRRDNETGLLAAGDEGENKTEMSKGEGGLRGPDVKEQTLDDAETRKTREAPVSRTPLPSEEGHQEKVKGKGKRQREEVAADQTSSISSNIDDLEDGEIDSLSNGRADAMPPTPVSEDASIVGDVETLPSKGEQVAKEGTKNTKQNVQPASQNSSLTGEDERASKTEEMEEMDISSDDVSCGFEGAEAASPCISEDDDDDDDDIGTRWGVFRVGGTPPMLSRVDTQSTDPTPGAAVAPPVPSPTATETVQVLHGPSSAVENEDEEKSASCPENVDLSDGVEPEGRESNGLDATAVEEHTLNSTSEGSSIPRLQGELTALEKGPEIAVVHPIEPQQTGETLALRSIVREQLHGVLRSSSKGREAALAGGDGNNVLERIASDTEDELFRRLYEHITGGRAYKAKYKQLLLSLGNVRNYRLVASVLAGNTSPIDLATKDAVGLLNSLSSSLNCLAIPLAGRQRHGNSAGSSAGKGQKGKGKRRGKMMML
eukprot:g5476.t1